MPITKKNLRELMKASPKILVFSSRGGGGHIAASEAIIEALEGIEEVEVYNALSSVFRKVDLFSHVSNKRFTAEDFYNLVLKKRLFRLVNLYGLAGKSYMQLNRSFLAKEAIKFLEEKKPKLVISVIPYFNGAFQDACQKLNIPFLIIPTDIEIASFLYGLTKEDAKNSLFRLGLAYEAQIKKAKAWGMDDSCIEQLGFPVKKACVRTLSLEEKQQLRKLYRFQQDSKIVTVTLGAAGTSLFYPVIQTVIPQLLNDCELIACAGRDIRSFKKTEAFLQQEGLLEYADEEKVIYSLSGGAKVHLYRFTKKMPDLMALSEVVISKTGSLSVSEALYLGKYLLLDHTQNSSSRKLLWERPNLEFVRSLKSGDGFFSIDDLSAKIEKLLTQSHVKIGEKNALLNMHDHLPDLIKEMLIQEAYTT